MVSSKYQIMAGEHKMVGTKSSIPEGIYTGDEVDVVFDYTSHGFVVAGNITNHSHHTERHEINNSPVWVSCAKQCSLFHLINKSSFCSIYAS